MKCAKIVPKKIFDFPREGFNLFKHLNFIEKSDAPQAINSPDLCLRRRALYPAELRDLQGIWVLPDRRWKVQRFSREISLKSRESISERSGSFEARPLAEHLRMRPVRVKEMRPNKSLERFLDSVKLGTALGPLAFE